MKERPNTWQHRARVRLDVLRYELAATPALPEDEWPNGVDLGEIRKGAEALLGSAEKFLHTAADGRSTWQRLRGWWSAELYEGTMANLHAAEVAVTVLSTPSRAWTRIDTVLATARPLCVHDPRLTRVEELRDTMAAKDPELPQSLSTLLAAAHAVEEERGVRSRNFRNRLIRTSGVLVLLLLSVVLFAGLTAPGAVPVCERTTCVGEGPSGTAEVALVMLFGVLGAALHVVARLQRMGGSWNPYGLPFYQEIIKLPIGALSALLAVSLLGTDWLPGVQPPESWQQVAAFAVVFGVAQIALTRQIDQRTDKLLAATPDKEEAEQLEKALSP